MLLKNSMLDMHQSAYYTRIYENIQHTQGNLK
jgi:hypothetical protein